MLAFESNPNLFKRTAKRERAKPGTLAYPFVSPDSNGIPIHLTSKKKRIVLIDFWASWCGPCMAQVPALKALHTEYAGQGFDIIGISIDEDRGRWRQALKMHHLPGLQVIAGNNQLLKDKYAVFGIPHRCLIDQDGRIIANGLRGAELTKKIAELLKDNY